MDWTLLSSRTKRSFNKSVMIQDSAPQQHQRTQHQHIHSNGLVIHLAERSVHYQGKALNISGLSYRLLIALLHAWPAVLSADELAQQVWNGRAVSDETIAQRVSLLRKALGAQARQSIESVRGEGYRWLPTVVYRTASEHNPKRAKKAAFIALALLIIVVSVSLLLMAQKPEAEPTRSVTTTAPINDALSLQLQRAHQFAGQHTPQANRHAIGLYREILSSQRDKHPSYLAAQMGLASALLDQVSKFNGDPALLLEAEQLSQQVLAVAPDNPRSLWLRGSYFDIQGELNAAIDWYEQALSAAPEETGIKGALAYLYTRRGQLHEALQLNIDTLSVLQRYQVLQIAEIMRLAQQDDIAQTWLEYAYKLLPDDPFAAVQMAKFHLSHQRYSAAQQSIEPLHASGIESSDTLEQLAVLALIANDYQQALVHIEQALQIKPDDFYSQAWYEWIAHEQGLASRYSEPQWADDRWPNTWVAQALFKFSRGDRLSAMNALSQAVDLGYLDIVYLEQLPPFEALQQDSAWQVLAQKVHSKVTTERLKIQNYALPRLSQFDALSSMPP